MKNLSMLFTALTLGLSASAQMELRGRIMDAQSQLGISSATLRLQSGQASVADENGSFVIRLGSAEKLAVNISAIGYHPLDTILMPGTVHALTLQPVRSLMQPIEIKAIRAGYNAPFTQSTVSAKDIARTNLGRDIPFLLDQTPSVVVHADAGNGVGYTGIRIRGTDASRINMTLNGIPYNDAESQGIFFVNLPDFASSAGSIQIQRGVGTSSNGTGAFGATLNISTNETTEKAYGEISSSIGSFNTSKNTIRMGTGLLGDAFTFDARLSRINSDGFVDRASSNLESFYVSSAYVRPRKSLRLNIFSGKEKTYQSWYGIPESMLRDQRTYNPAGTEKPGDPYDNETDNYRQTHAQLFYNQSFSDRISLQTALFYTRGIGYYEQYKASRRFSSIGLPNPVINGTSVTRTDLIRQLWLDNHFFGQTFSLQYSDKSREIIGGGGGTRYLGNHYGKIIWATYAIPKDYKWYDHDASKDDVNFYVKWQEKLGGRWVLFGDVQYRHVGYQIDGFRDNPQLTVDNKWNFLNPKFGVSLLLNGAKAYISYAKASKEPNRDDFEAGSLQQPRAEHLHDLEAGYERVLEKGSWNATLYYMRYIDQLVLTGKINDVGAYTRTNIPNSYRAGLELSGKWRPRNWLELNGNLTWSRNRILGLTVYYDDYDTGGQKLESIDRSPIAFSPDMTAAAGITFRLGRQTDISLPAKYVGRQYLDNTGNKDRSLDAYFVQDVVFTWRPTWRLAKETRLTFMVNNVFNAAYEPNGYTYTYFMNTAQITENGYFPMAGTNIMAGLTLRW